MARRSWSSFLILFLFILCWYNNKRIIFLAIAEFRRWIVDTTSSSEEESEHFATRVLSSSFFVIEDAVRRGQDDVTRRKIKRRTRLESKLIQPDEAKQEAFDRSINSVNIRRQGRR